jgi:glc operon protein GlcG
MNGIHEVTGSIPVWSTNLRSRMKAKVPTVARTVQVGPPHQSEDNVPSITRFVSILFAALVLSLAFGRTASAQIPNPFGTPVNLDAAKKAAAAAIAEARKNNWTMAVAVVDTGGDLVHFEKMDGTQTGSVTVAIEKARSAALFKRPTKAFQDVVAAGGEGLRLLALSGAVPIEGGVPIVLDGKFIGAIGVSGGTSAQDGVAAAAGVATMK